MNLKRHSGNNCLKYIAWLLLCCFCNSLLATEPSFSKEQLQWLESNQEHPAAEVNEGVLDFLANGPNKPEHIHENHLWINQETVDTGWAKLEQCHTNLDAVPALQILFNQDRIKYLKIVSKRNIGSARVQEHRVLLHNIDKNAKICIEAWSKAFRPTANNHYALINGPFMRKFLDGYYPLSVTLSVHYPESILKLVKIRPAPQNGWKVQYRENQVILSGRFKGELKTHLLFKYLPES